MEVDNTDTTYSIEEGNGPTDAGSEETIGPIDATGRFLEEDQVMEEDVIEEEELDEAEEELEEVADEYDPLKQPRKEEEERDDGSIIPFEKAFEWNFYLEDLLTVAYIMFIAMFVACGCVTELYIKPREIIYVDKIILGYEETKIFGIFGFNHICSWFDYQPSRMIAALIVPFGSIPTMLYIVLFHLRLLREYGSKVSMWLLGFSWIASPLCFLSVLWLHLWFVNSPEEEYFGFLGHYVPFAAWQIALALLAILQIWYLEQNLTGPGAKSSAQLYMFLLVGLSANSLAAVITTMTGKPMLDTKDDAQERLGFRFIMYTYGFMVVVMPLYFSCVLRCYNGKRTITYK